MQLTKQALLFNMPAIEKVAHKEKADRKAICHLLKGGSIVDATEYGSGFRVYDIKQNVVLKMHAKAFKKIYHLLKKKPNTPNSYVISKSAIRKEHGSTMYKRLYKLNLLNQKELKKKNTNDSIHKTKNAASSL